MTRQIEFNTYGCACRCLLRIASSVGPSMTESEFIVKFISLFPPGKLGLTTPPLIDYLAKSMQLATHLTPERDYGLLRGMLDDPSTAGILVCTERMRNGGGDLVELYHCMTLEKVRPQSFDLWNPTQDGSSHTLTNLPRTEWDAMGCTAIILSR